MRKQLILGVLACVVLFPGVSRAGGFRFSIGWEDRHGSVHFGIETGIGRRIRHLPVPRRVWVPGHYVERIEYVRVPGRWERKWVPPVVRTVFVFGCWETVIVQEGYWTRVWIPPRTVPHTVRVWVPGRWVLR